MHQCLVHDAIRLLAPLVLLANCLASAADPAKVLCIALPRAPELSKKGFYLSRMLIPQITYTAFDLRDPVVGRFSKEKVALRREIMMA